MRGRSKDRLRLSVIASLSVITIGGLLFGKPGAVGGFILALLIFALLHDNDLGTFFPVAVLFVLVIIVLTLLVGLLALLGSR